MGDIAEQVVLEYDYIDAHRGFWQNDVAPEIAKIMKETRGMQLRCRNSYLFEEFLKVHEELVAFVQARSDEGHQTAYDIARVLAEIKAYFESAEQYNSWLVQKGRITK